MNPTTGTHQGALARTWVLLRLGLHDEATDSARRLAAEAWGFASTPAEDTALWTGVVDILRESGQTGAALDLIRGRHADAICSDRLSGAWGVWLLVHDLDAALASQCLQRAAAALPDSHELLAWQTLAWSRQGQDDTAWPRWQALFDRVPDPAPAREHGARVWAWLRRSDLAASCLQGLGGNASETDGLADRWREARVRHLWRALRDEAPEPLPVAALVREEFDQAAATYDAHLQALDNRGPVLLQRALDRSGIQAGAMLEVLDAGCGTGLCAEVLRPVAARLDGLDLSPAMLDQARARGLYDELVEADLLDAARAVRCPADLIVCWDVLVYFGDLVPPMASLAALLAPGGRLLVLVEAAASGRQCGIGGRHAHGVDHLQQALAAAGLRLQWLVTEPHLRREFAAPVACHVAAALR